MARPQGEDRKLMVPLGSSLRVASNTSFNTVLNVYEDIANITGSGVVLAQAVQSTASIGGDRNYTAQYNIDGSGFTPLDFAGGGMRHGFNQSQDNKSHSGLPLFISFNRSFRAQMRHTVTDAATDPYKASIWYAERLTPAVETKIGGSAFTDVGAGQENTFLTVLDITNQGGQVNFINFIGPVVALGGIAELKIRLTFDSVTMTFDLANDILIPPELNQHRAGAIPFPLKWHNNFKLEFLASTDNANGTKRASIFYNLDA